MHNTPAPAQLQPTDTIDAAHPAVIAFASQHSSSDNTDIENAVSLYYAVRDGFRYDPYDIDLERNAFKASTTLELGYGWCVSKAILLAACCRAVGIPARLGFADVRNHLTSEKLRRAMQTDLFMWHGYTDILLNGQWVKATPAFNLSLCEKADIHPLEFDGLRDSIYHEFDKDGNKHMEYVSQRGEFDDLPYQQIIDTFEIHYADMQQTGLDANFEHDVESEHQPG